MTGRDPSYVRQLLALQRSAGNAATTASLALGSRVPAQPVLRRSLARGSGTGWGWPGWVDGGKELWGRIDKGFNADLLKLLADMESLKVIHPGIKGQIAKTRRFVKVWDGRTQIFHQANPPTQDIDADTLADMIEAEVATAESAIAAAESAIAAAKKPPPPLEPEVATPKAKRAKRKKTSAPEGGESVPQSGGAAKSPVTTPVSDELVLDAGGTPPTLDAPSKGPGKGAGKSKRSAGPNKAQQAMAAKNKQAEELEQRQKANLEKKAAQAARVDAVDKFGAALKAATGQLLRDEKINAWNSVYAELDEIVAAAKSRVMGDPNVERNLKSMHEKWIAIVAEHQEANKVDRQGTAKQWTTWLGLDRYVIVDAGQLGKPEHTSLVPEAGTEGPSGPSYDIHVTLDPAQVRAPTKELNDQTVDELLDDLLSVNNVALRIHATLETGHGSTPHVYWQDNDLGQGVRYPWGSAHWNAPGGAKEKVAEVLDNYVADNIRPKVALEHKQLTFKPYIWPAFPTLSAPVLVKTEQ